MKQTETPLLCVVTTIYHARRYLPITLNMMARQKCKRFIHVIYVDGDSENYDDIIEGYRHSCGGTDNRWPDIRFIRGSHNLGCDLAHRYCFAHLPEECTHFCWLDAGDWVDASFVGRFYKRYRFHRDCSWFHFNSIHYDKETVLSVGKDSYHSFNKSLLRKKEQLPAFAFRQFYYHVMVIEKSAFREINPKCELFGPDVHQGAFYDSQVLVPLLLARKRMLYDKKCLVHIMRDPNSVASSFVSSEGKSYQFWRMYLSSLSFEEKMIDLFIEYYELGYLLSQWNLQIIQDTINLARMRDEKKRLQNLIQDNGLPTCFGARKFYFNFLLFLAGHYRLAKIYRKLQNSNLLRS